MIQKIFKNLIVKVVLCSYLPTEFIFLNTVHLNVIPQEPSYNVRLHVSCQDLQVRRELLTEVKAIITPEKCKSKEKSR